MNKEPTWTRIILGFLLIMVLNVLIVAVPTVLIHIAFDLDYYKSTAIGCLIVLITSWLRRK